MTDFIRTKISFALALLGTLFVLHPLVEKYGDRGFHYLDFFLQVFQVYAVVAALVAFSVYGYAVALVSERRHSWAERTGNSCYALALVVPPLYVGLYASALVASKVGQSHLAWSGPTVAVGLGAIWVLGSPLVAIFVRRRLGTQDRAAEMEQLATTEVTALDRSGQMFQNGHYDLSVVEAWKAFEARLRRVFLRRGLTCRTENPDRMIAAAARAGIIQKSALDPVDDLRRQWNVAISTEPLTREAAESALAAARNILATIAVPDQKKSM